MNWDRYWVLANEIAIIGTFFFALSVETKYVKLTSIKIFKKFSMMVYLALLDRGIIRAALVAHVF